jgi:hypothetical protein
VFHLAAFQQPAGAAPFGWQDCSSCPSHQAVRYSYDSRDKNDVRRNIYPGDLERSLGKALDEGREDGLMKSLEVLCRDAGRRSATRVVADRPAISTA